MTQGEKKYIDIFINKCEKYDESVEVKGVSVGEESRILDTVVKYLKSIEKQQAEIEKKDKIIDLMAEQLAGLAIWNNDIEESLILGDKKEVIEYFTNKVEEEIR